MDENHIANVRSEPHPHHWRLFIVVLVLIGLYAAFWGLRPSRAKFDTIANTPSENPGQVTDEERATIDAIRHAPPAEQ